MGRTLASINVPTLAASGDMTTASVHVTSYGRRCRCC